MRTYAILALGIILACFLLVHNWSETVAPRANPQNELAVVSHDLLAAEHEAAQLEREASQKYVRLTEIRKTLNAKKPAEVYAFNLKAADYARINTLIVAQQKEVLRLKKLKQLLESNGTPGVDIPNKAPRSSGSTAEPS